MMRSFAIFFFFFFFLLSFVGRFGGTELEEGRNEVIEGVQRGEEFQQLQDFCWEEEEEEEEKGEEEVCYPYLLSNECSSFISFTNVPSSLQSSLFSNLSIAISDIRMFPPLCRHSLLWLICSEAFVPCIVDQGGEKGEEKGERGGERGGGGEKRREKRERKEKREETQMGTLCPISPIEAFPSIELLCPLSSCSLTFLSSPSPSPSLSPLSLSPSPSPSPSSSSSSLCPTTTTSLSIAQETISKVTTCIDSSFLKIECCFDPYQLDENGECVVSCPQYDLEYERIFSLIAFGLIWASTALFIISIIPVLFLKQMWVFPAYVCYLTSFCGLLMAHVCTWSSYVGGPVEYMCPSTSYTKSRIEFGNSSKCTIQASLFAFFLCALSYWQFILSLCVMSYPYSNRFPFFKHFRPSSSSSVYSSSISISYSSFGSSSIEKKIHLIGWGGSFVAMILFVFLPSQYQKTTQDTVYDGTSFFTYLPCQYACVLYPFGLGMVFYLSQFLLVFLSLIFLGAGVVGICRMNWRLVLIQWRSIIYSLYVCILMLFLEFTLLLAMSLNSWIHIELFASCVACHPQDVSSSSSFSSSSLFSFSQTTDDPICQREYFSNWWYYCLEILFFSYVGFVCVVLYLTNPLISDWWRKIFSPYSSSASTSTSSFSFGSFGSSESFDTSSESLKKKMNSSSSPSPSPSPSSSSPPSSPISVPKNTLQLQGESIPLLSP